MAPLTPAARDQSATGTPHQQGPSRALLGGGGARTRSVHHADVGSITLSYQAFDVSSAPGQQLIIYQAEPASSSEHALVLLGTIAATGSLDADAFRNI